LQGSHVNEIRRKVPVGLRNSSAPGPAIDEVDRQILLHLQRDGRLTNSEIGRRLGLAEGTIRRRIDRMLAEGVVHIAAVANPFKIGLPIVVLIGIEVDPPRMAEAAGRLVEMPQVRYVGYSTGTYDIIVEALFPSNQALLHFLTDELAKIRGIRKTETSLQLDVLKRSYEWQIPPVGVEVREDSGDRGRARRPVAAPRSFGSQTESR
jgi:Lrp/AsnC family transcriptional regulator for asnA, asnC and gidA